MSRIMARLYHVLVSMIYGHDTGVASPGRDGANNLYLYFYIMMSLCIYFVCRFNFLVPCVSIQLADSTDPFNMKDSATSTLLCRRRRGMASGAPAPATQMPVDEDGEELEYEDEYGDEFEEEIIAGGEEGEEGEEGMEISASEMLGSDGVHA